jgi:hypothetical protein
MPHSTGEAGRGWRWDGGPFVRLLGARALLHLRQGTPAAPLATPPSPLAAAHPKTLSGNFEGATQPNDLRVASGASFQCAGTPWPADLTDASGAYVVGGAICGARRRVCGGEGGTHRGAGELAPLPEILPERMGD